MSKHKLVPLAIIMMALGATPAALAGLGPIKVLSSAGEAFEAEIPVLDENPQGAVVVRLADRNHYSLVAPYTTSAGRLQFSLLRRADGVVSKVRVSGPSDFPEPLLHFAVEMSWPAGRVVREFEVDYLRDGPHHKKKSPLHDDNGKKPAVPVEPVHRLDNLGLGELTVKSRLGEPMLAELELFGSALRPGKALHVGVFAESPVESASPSAAQRQWTASVTHRLLRQASGRFVLQLRSSEPVIDPVLAFRLEVAIANVKAQKQFLLLLEPQVEPLHALDASKHVAQHLRQVSHGATHGLKTYRVVQGDTLSSIARRIKRRGAVADIVRQLYRANPQAFANASPNSLKAGVLLHYSADWVLPEAGVELPVAEHHAPAAAIASAPQGRAVPAATVATLEQQLKQQDKVLARVGAKAKMLEERLRRLSASEPRPTSSAAASAGSTAPAPVLVARPNTPPAKPVAVSVPSVQPVLDDDDHRMLYGGAAATTLLAALLLLRQRQKKRAAAESAPAGQASSCGVGESLTGASLFFEGDNLSGSELVELTGDDPISEAEVYLAYGRVDQALEVLREGLVREPLRQDLRYKLLEVLATQPDLDVFIAEATSAKGILGHGGLLWQRVCELGQKVAPDHPLFVLPATPMSEAVSLAEASSVRVPEPVVVKPSRLAELPKGNDELASAQPVPPVVPARQVEVVADQASPQVMPAPAARVEPPVESPAVPETLAAAVPDSEDALLRPSVTAEAVITGAAITTPASDPELSEIDAKLELAKLYREMGDNDAALALMAEIGAQW